MEKAPSAYPISLRLLSFDSCAVPVPMGSGFIMGPIHEEDSSPLTVTLLAHYMQPEVYMASD